MTKLVTISLEALLVNSLCSTMISGDENRLLTHSVDSLIHSHGVMIAIRKLVTVYAVTVYAVTVYAI